MVLGFWLFEKLTCVVSFHSQRPWSFQREALAYGRLQWVAIKLLFFHLVQAPSRLHASALCNQRAQAVFRLS